jgi:hypothetical protein
MIRAIYDTILGLVAIEIKPIQKVNIQHNTPHIPNHYKGINKKANYNRLTNK